MNSLGCLGETYNIIEMKICRNFDAFIDFELFEFEVPMICLATACVSVPRDARYIPF